MRPSPVERVGHSLCRRLGDPQPLPKDLAHLPATRLQYCHHEQRGGVHDYRQCQEFGFDALTLRLYWVESSMASISTWTGNASDNSPRINVGSKVICKGFCLRLHVHRSMLQFFSSSNTRRICSMLCHRRTLTGGRSCCKDITMAKGSQNTRITTKKNNPFSGGHPGASTSGKQRQRSMESSRKKDVPRFPNGASLNVDTLSRNSSSSTRTDHRTFYDRISVRQWAAETDPNAPANSAEYGFQQATYAADVPAMSAAPQLPGSFPVSCSSVSHVSLPVTHGFPSVDLNTTCAEAGLHGMAPNFGIPPNTESLACMDPMKNYDYEAWSYPTPTAEDMAYSTATASYLPFGEASNIEPRFANWSSGAFLPDDEFSRTDHPCGSQPVAWSPLLATDPSVSSSYSRSSVLAMPSSTPLSPVAQEPDWPTGHDLGQEEENGFYPAFSIGEAFPLSAVCQFTQNNDMRFVRSLCSPSHPTNFTN